MPYTQLLPPNVAPTSAMAFYTDTSDPFSWGLRPEQDYVLTEPFALDPNATETLNVWFYDSTANIGINIHPINIQNGEITGILVTVFLADGRIFRQSHDTPVKFTDRQNPRTQHIRYSCVEPFHQWLYCTEELPVWETNKAELNTGTVAEKTPSNTLSLSLAATMKTPAFLQGGILPEAAAAIEGDTCQWIGARIPTGMSSEAFRFDQMFHGVGSLTVDGKTYQLDGYGLRGHVRGVRVMGGMSGHTWAGGITPKGTAFGIQTFPRPEGGFHFSEAYIYKDGVMYPNRVIYAERMSFDPNQGNYIIQLACDQLGTTEIIARDKALFWWSMPAWGSGEPLRWGIGPSAQTVMRQAVTEYQLLGETGYGMCERSGARPTIA